ncbi:MAG: hypothetical protein QW279_07330 [Candidatus Jordarchaeaceae archaeon]
MDDLTIYKEILDHLEKIISDKNVLEEIYTTMIRGAVNSGETQDSRESLLDWFNSRFMPNSIILDRSDYSKALIRSLWISPNLASLDFAGGRLRDFAQLWTDTARGFLGEIAVQKFLKKNFDMSIYLETRRGKAEEFMSSDIRVIEQGTNKHRESKIKVSIKTTKLNGRWLEIPESQFKQSDVFILVKLGISRYHFISYLKETIKNLLKEGLNLNELDEKQVEILANDIPNWNSIPAYIPGFVDKANLTLPIHKLSFNFCRKRKKDAYGIRPISKIEITDGIGLFSRSEILKVEEIKNATVPQDIPIVVAGIEKEIDGNFYASSGQLTFAHEEWKKIVAKF